MNNVKQQTIYTIGHSTHTIEVFLAMLQSFDIKTLVDVRRFPGSRKYPQFNQDALKESLEKNGIEYFHLEELGGRRKVSKDSKNNTWKNVSFKGYADYMETDAFKNGVLKLEGIASNQHSVIMCSEVLWWRCHRSMISDFMKAAGWNVLHIMAVGKSQEHRYTAPARIVGNTVDYSDVDV